MRSPAQQRCDLLACKRRIVARAVESHHHVEPREHVLMASKCFPDETLRTIAIDRSPQLPPRHDERDARDRKSVRMYRQAQPRRAPRPASTECRSDIGAAHALRRAQLL